MGNNLGEIELFDLKIDIMNWVWLLEGTSRYTPKFPYS
jgi:hypothetical protein